MRIVIRDAEWVVRRVDRSSDGGQLLTCDGVSELVRERESKFLTKLEGRIDVLDPAETKLEADDSSGYSKSLLYIESLLRQRSVNDAQIHVAHKGAMDLVPYQLDPVVQALQQPRQRILIADAVGLGKTLEAGILVSELIHRGRGKRILVLTQKSMLTQFQKEFWNRFTIPLTRLDSIGLQRVRNRIPTNHNPFYYYDKSIISIDTLKQDSEYRVYLEQAYWDIIIIDECHNVADRGTSSQRARLAKLLSSRSDTLIMLSATPHDGRARSFASLMNMLDPTAIADPDSYKKEDFTNKGLVVRRFKKDIQHQVDKEFKDRKVYKMTHPAGPEEEAAYDALLEVPFTRAGEFDPGKPNALLRVGIQKGLFSSPAACRKSVSERIAKLSRLQEKEPKDPINEEITALHVLDEQLNRIGSAQFSKYQAFLKLLKSDRFGWSKQSADDRLVIFSERIETLNFLLGHLSDDLKLKQPGNEGDIKKDLKNAQIAIMQGSMSDVEQQEIVEQFGKPESKLRVLLCSDVAAEGINLHYQSHRLIHFDMPWSLMVFQQRNGRIDRYGQEQEPQIYYLITESQNETIRGDMRILEVLQEKDEQAYENIGDPSVFMNVYDIDAEEKITEKAMAEGRDADAFDKQYQPDDSKKNEGDEILKLFLAGGAGAQQPTDPTDLPIDEPESLYDSSYDWCKAALKQLEKDGLNLQWSSNDGAQRITLVAPDDLRHRFKFLPKEIRPEDYQFVLTDDIEVMKDEIARSREDENAWPKIHYLWQQHPVSEWLQDRMLASFGRHTAPVMWLPEGLAQDEIVFVISGLVPNRKSHPLVHEWLAVCFIDGEFARTESFAEFQTRTGLGSAEIPNRADDRDLSPMQALLPAAVAQARKVILERRDEFEAMINTQLDVQLAELERLKATQLTQLDLKLERSSQSETRKAAEKEQRSRDIHDVFDDYLQWIEDTMTTERNSYLQVIAVCGKA